jgi:hypothetical protein
MRVFCRVLSWAGLACLSISFAVGTGPLLAATPPTLPTTSAPVDIYGRSVVDQQKRPVNFSEAETAGLTSLVAPPQVPASRAQVFEPSALVGGPFELAWHPVMFGVGIGSAGFAFIDWNGSGSAELIASGGTSGFANSSYWYVVEQSGSAFEVGFAIFPYADTLTAVRAIDRDGDGDQELLVAHGKTFEIWDAETGQPQILESSVTTAAEIKSLEYIDVDSDGRSEYVFCSGSDLWIQDSVTHLVDHKRLNAGCGGLAVGNVDADPQLEIVLTGGLVIDSAGYLMQWSNPATFGKIVRVGDLDGNGIAEVVAGFAWYWIRVYDASAQVEVLALPIDLDLAALRLFDVDGDSLPELVYGDGQWGRVYVLDGQSGAEIFSKANPEHGVTELAFGDVDGNSGAELVFGAGFTSTGPDKVFAWKPSQTSFAATSTDLDGPFLGLEAADLDGDGVNELVHSVFSSDSGIGGGYLFLRDAASREIEAIIAPVPFQGFQERFRVEAANLDGDPQLELIATHAHYVQLLDSTTLAVQWTAQVSFHFDFTGLAIGDLEGDGSVEVVVSAHRTLSGSQNQNYFFVYDGATGALEWQSGDLGSNLRNYALLRLAEVDGDAALEIVVAQDRGELQVWDGMSRTRQSQTADLNITAMATADLSGDGIAEIIIGTEAGALQRINPGTGVVASTYGTFTGGAIQGLDFLEFDADSVPDMVFTVGAKITIRNGATGAMAWQSGALGPAAGNTVAALDSLKVGDFDGDGGLEIWLNLGVTGMALFEAAAADTPPNVTIQSPATGSAVTVGTTVAFAAQALDLSEGDISADITWTSNLDGSLGAGATLATAGLSIGIHSITATAIDGAGQSGSATISLRIRPLPVTVTFTSIGAEDGLVVESSETSSVGGSVAPTHFRLGDSPSDRQHRGILSFDTSALPEGAEIQATTVRIRRQALINTNPFETHGACLADVKKGSFNGSDTLEIGDFEAVADAPSAAILSNPVNHLDFAVGNFDAAGRAAVNTSGRTQVRLRFELDDNDDLQEDYMTLFSGENVNNDYRPKLVVTYQE